MKNRLKKKEVLLGTWITIPNNNLIEIMTNSGFDWLALDLEHSSINLNQAEDIIRIINMSKIKSFVRLPSINKDIIKKVMDIGAQGLIIPDLRNLSELKQVFDSSHYPPQGSRGVGLMRANQFGDTFDHYYNWQKNNIILIAQIENIKALENLDEIFSSKLIDAYFIGPYDLSASMKIPGDFKNNKFKKVIDRIKTKADKYNVPHGIHVINPEINEIKSKIKENYSFIACSLETVILKNKFKDFTSILKK